MSALKAEMTEKGQTQEDTEEQTAADIVSAEPINAEQFLAPEEPEQQADQIEPVEADEESFAKDEKTGE